MNITENFLDDIIKNTRRIRSLGADKEYGFSYDMKFFLKLMYSIFTPQSYGFRIENRLIKELNLIKVKSSMDRGDCMTIDGKFGEIKTSFSDMKGNFNFVQLRLHQKLDFYLFFVIDVYNNFTQYIFLIPGDKIKNSLKILKASNSHGVLKNKKDITQLELRFTVNKNDDSWVYLVDNYLVDNLNELSEKLLNI